MKRRNFIQKPCKIKRFCLGMIVLDLVFISACNSRPLEDTTQKVADVEQEEMLEKSGGYGGMVPDQMELCLEGDILYYCDHNREAELYAYNMQTGEEVMIAEQQGYPYKTNHGCFYLIGDFVYEMEGLQLQFLCEVPEDGDFLDYKEGKILWAKRNHFLREDFECFSRQELYLQKRPEGKDDLLLSKEDSEKIYDVSDSTKHFYNVAWMGEKLYIGQGDGLFCLNLAAKEIKQIYDKDIMGVYTDGESLVFKGYVEGSDYMLLYVEPETGEVREIDRTLGNVFLLLKDGVVYYRGIGIASYDIRNGSTKKLTEDSQYSHQDYYMAELYGDTMILRHGYGYYFAVLDMITGEVKRVTG